MYINYISIIKRYVGSRVSCARGASWGSIFYKKSAFNNIPICTKTMTSQTVFEFFLIIFVFWVFWYTFLLRQLQQQLQKQLFCRILCIRKQGFIRKQGCHNYFKIGLCIVQCLGGGRWFAHRKEKGGGASDLSPD